jgi:hypothetical protein
MVLHENGMARPQPPAREPAGTYPAPPYGTGTLYVKPGNWHGRWRVAGRKVNRKLGPPAA